MLKKDELKKIGLDINIPEEFISSCLLDTSFFSDQIEDLLHHLKDKNPGEYLDKLLTLLNDDVQGHKAFVCFLYLANQTKQEYINRKIPLSIFYDTFKCIEIQIKNSLTEFGEYRFTSFWWNFRQGAMRIFKIGEFEYELTHNFVIDGLAIHIPAKAKLNKESIESSLSSVKQFLKEFYPAYLGHPIWIDSWLVDPKITELLPETSNIKVFSSYFDINKHVDNKEAILQWIFHADSKVDIKNLDEKTSLQRAVKGKMLEGEIFGTGIGQVKEKWL